MQHGGLLAMSELFRAANRDWEMRFRDIEETILAEAGGGLDLGAVGGGEVEGQGLRDDAMALWIDRRGRGRVHVFWKQRGGRPGGVVCQ